MNRREAVPRLLLIGVAPLVAIAQTERQVRRIGYLSLGIAQSNAAWLAAFHAGMVELRWVEGRDYVIDDRVSRPDPVTIQQRVAVRWPGAVTGLIWRVFIAPQRNKVR